MIKFKLTKTDYNAFIKSHLLKYFDDHIYYLIILPIILTWLITPKPQTLISFVLIWISLTTSINLIYIIYPYIRFRRSLNKVAVDTGDLYGEKIIEITENGLSIGANEKINILNWESIKSVTVNDKFIYIVFVTTRFLIIPINSFQGDSEISNFIQTINSNSKPQYAFKIPERKNIKPPYFLGLVCLVPAIGILVGLYLILTGILKYKNNWLIIIGLAGVIYSISIIYYIKKDQIRQFNDQRYQKGLIQYTQGQLNNLVKDIEFYKLIHGSYPKDLYQLQKYDKSVVLQDEISKQGTLFNYKKIGDKYLLNSNGFDGIPNTKDDVFPSLTRTDSTSIGLIIK
jgi:hypothetical protein